MHSVFILEQTEYNYFSKNRILKLELELEQTNNDCVLRNVVSDAAYCYCRVAWSIGLSVGISVGLSVCLSVQSQ